MNNKSQKYVGENGQCEKNKTISIKLEYISKFQNATTKINALEHKQKPCKYIFLKRI